MFNFLFWFAMIYVCVSLSILAILNVKCRTLNFKLSFLWPLQAIKWLGMILYIQCSYYYEKYITK